MDRRWVSWTLSERKSLRTFFTFPPTLSHKIRHFDPKRDLITVLTLSLTSFSHSSTKIPKYSLSSSPLMILHPSKLGFPISSINLQGFLNNQPKVNGFHPWVLFHRWSPRNFFNFPLIWITNFHGFFDYMDLHKLWFFYVYFNCIVPMITSWFPQVPI